ncbi:hypothetical protein KDW_45660 [Dictyobacter vulcani]|uniref:Sialidase domain-containing protein n=1 Tax=Dictyobacter vulcani TaxID=2607529 RepID=A0A5J4KLU6_9CHLR|nr:sialidase family protein [Dictyobacter vulcani]GER90404.1 hypothetical protein KDW_45660 [Dictyobacter vulcani]
MYTMLKQQPGRLTGALVLLMAILLVGCSASKADAETPSQQAQPVSHPARIAMTNTWEALALPVKGAHLEAYAVSPANPQTIFICLSSQSSQLEFWQTHDNGQHWAQVVLPGGLSGTTCSLSIDRAQPQRIALAVQTTGNNQLHLYLSNNGGTSWQHITHSVPASVINQQEASVSLHMQHIYLWYSYGGGQNSPQRAMLERSDDNGQSWTRADTAFGTSSMFFAPIIGQGENLAILVQPVSTNKHASSTLWTSNDSGHSWQQGKTVPPQVQAYLQQSPSWPSTATPFYALAYEQLPSNLYQLQIVQSANGQQWSGIPGLPVAGTNQKKSGLLQVLGVTDTGQMLAFGVDPNVGLPVPTGTRQSTKNVWLWIWNPGTARWSVLSKPLEHTTDESCAALCWNTQLMSTAQHTSYLYAYHQGEQDWLYRLRLPNLK